MNLSTTSPAPPPGNTNVIWQSDYAVPSSISAYVPLVFVRTLVIANTTIGTSIANPVTVYSIGNGTGVALTALLHTTITSALAINVNMNGSLLINLSVPSSTALNTAVVSTTFLATLIKGAVLTWDITASDGSISSNGIASFTLTWT